MNEKYTALPEVCGRLASQRLPRWAELPDLELYMDQVLALAERYLRGYPGFEEKGLTASMVNNYVKLGALPAPVKKKYARGHLARLMMICVLKSSLPIADIQRLIAREGECCTEEQLYDAFCEMFEETNAAAAEDAARRLRAADGQASLAPVYCAALRAGAEQALAQQLFAEAFPEE